MRTLVVLGALLLTPFAVAQQAGPPQSLANESLAYYPFDINAEDETGHGLDAAASSGVNYVRGVLGNAASFTTPDATVALPRLPQVTNFTVAAWVHWSAGTSAKEDFRTIVGRLYLHPSTGRLVYFYYPVAGTQKQAELQFWSNGTIAPNAWHHVALTYVRAGNLLQFYVDGKPDSATTAPSAIRAPFPPTAVNAIGSAGNASGKGASLNGAIDELLLYSRALTPAEVLYLTTVAITNPNVRGAAKSLAASCGNAYETPCVYCSSHYAWPPWKWGDCEYHSGYCNEPIIYRPDRFTCAPPPKDPAVFTVTALPAIIQIDDRRILQNIVGYQAIITNARSATYVVKDSRAVGADCARLRAWIQNQCDADSPQCRVLRGLRATCNQTPPTCEQTGIKSTGGTALRYPLYTLAEWQNIEYTRLKINANWFDINGPPSFPHISPCTSIYGYSVSNGVEVSSATRANPTGTAAAPGFDLLDALVVIPSPTGDTQTISIVANSDIAQLRNVRQAVGGFILVKNGTQVTTFAESTKPLTSGARTGVGISRDGNILTVVVVQPGPSSVGMTARDLAIYMRRDLQAFDVINLDNSGSSQFYYESDVDETVSKSKPGDRDDRSQLAWRPIPNFFGIR